MFVLSQQLQHYDLELLVCHLIKLYAVYMYSMIHCILSTFNPQNKPNCVPRTFWKFYSKPQRFSTWNFNEVSKASAPFEFFHRTYALRAWHQDSVAISWTMIDMQTSANASMKNRRMVFSLDLETKQSTYIEIARKISRNFHSFCKYPFSKLGIT